MPKGNYTKKNVWDEAYKLKLVRDDEPIDPGANFFILMLDQLGLRTAWSCEGHPGGFYVSFSGSYEDALEIKKPGFFSIEIEGEDYWSLRLGEHVNRSDSERIDALRWAAEAWEKKFGPLDFDNVELVGFRKQGWQR